MKKYIALILLLLCIRVFGLIPIDNKGIPIENHYIQNIFTTNDSNIIDKAYIDWTDYKYFIETKFIDKTIYNKGSIENKITTEVNSVFIDLILNTKLNYEENIYHYAKNNLKYSEDYLKNNLRNFEPNTIKNDKDQFKYQLNMDISNENIIKIKNTYLLDDYNIIDNYLSKNNKTLRFSEPYKPKIFGTNVEFACQKVLKNDLKHIPCEFNKDKKITGLIIKIDNKNIKLSPSVCPKIRLSNGDVIYSPSIWLHDENNKKLICKEISDFSYIKNTSTDKTQGDNPLIVYPINVAGLNGVYTDIVLDTFDAYLVQQYFFYLLDNHIFNENIINISKNNSDFMYVDNILDPWSYKVNKDIFASPEKICLGSNFDIIDIMSRKK